MKGENLFTIVGRLRRRTRDADIAAICDALHE
jgi:hypothetical protein